MPYTAVLVPDLLAGERLDYAARLAGADLVFCQHLNSLADPTPNYSLAITAREAHPSSEAWGLSYATLVAQSMTRAGVPQTGGPRVWRGRPEADQIRGAPCPAILAEPLFLSRLEAAIWVLSTEGREELARCAAESIREALPEGGRVSLLCGHLGQVRRPDDKGAPVRLVRAGVAGLVYETVEWEGNLALDILLRVQRLLEE